MNLCIKNLNLGYSYKTVLNDLSVKFGGGKIHGVLGENGAGKSTLAKIISGEIIPDSGSIFCDETQLFPSKNFSVKNSIDNGICYVHQRPLLAESATIYENVILGLKNIDKKNIEELMKIWLKDYSPSTLVKDTGGDCNFFTALICALLKKPRILILDEPCALLNDAQTDFLYSKLAELKNQGVNIIVITHSKKEAETFCDTITILDDGKVLYNSDSPSLENTDVHFLNKNIDDEKSTESKNSNSKNTDSISLEFTNLNCQPVNKPAISNISFKAISGEITLIEGLAENGLETLENVVTGMETSRFSGEIKICKNLDGQNCKHFQMQFKRNNFNTNILRNKSGFCVAIIPSDKTFRASHPGLTIKQILSGATVSPKELIERAEININENEKAYCLSGGMLQRLILQRELSLNPEILIFCEPLQGLDYASSQKICDILKKLAEEGKIVVVLSSSEFPKTICNKHYKLQSGRITL